MDFRKIPELGLRFPIVRVISNVEMRSGHGWPLARPAGSLLVHRVILDRRRRKFHEGRNCGMIHFTCDMCGKELLEGDRDHYVARIEIRAANDSFEL
ncbi:MAG: hypothetical protein IH987_20520, partial [Planctomycetes bacterium]|nr:hypothetical protein [Planctomycetota bacterium]